MKISEQLLEDACNYLNSSKSVVEAIMAGCHAISLDTWMPFNAEAVHLAGFTVLAVFSDGVKFDSDIFLEAECRLRGGWLPEGEIKLRYAAPE